MNRVVFVALASVLAGLALGPKQMNGAKPQAEVAGRYKLVRVDGAWKFQQRRALPPG
jgi:hypothetical protein